MGLSVKTGSSPEFGATRGGLARDGLTGHFGRTRFGRGVNLEFGASKASRLVNYSTRRQLVRSAHIGVLTLGGDSIRSSYTSEFVQFVRSAHIGVQTILSYRNNLILTFGL